MLAFWTSSLSKVVEVSHLNLVRFLDSCLDCADGWSHQQHLCWRPLSLRLNWTEAINECEILKSNLPTFQASNALQLSVNHVWLNSSSQDDVMSRRREKTLKTESPIRNISDVCPTISKDKRIEKFPCCVKLHVICVKSRDE